MKPVITQFIRDIQQDQDAARHPDSKAGHVDKRIAFVPIHISQCDL